MSSSCPPVQGCWRQSCRAWWAAQSAMACRCCGVRGGPSVTPGVFPAELVLCPSDGAAARPHYLPAVNSVLGGTACAVLRIGWRRAPPVAQQYETHRQRSSTTWPAATAVRATTRPSPRRCAQRSSFSVGVSVRLRGCTLLPL